MAIDLPIDSFLGYSAIGAVEAQAGGVSGDPILNARVKAIGRRITPFTPYPNAPYLFKVADSDEVNAFALPGGPVYVNKGLLEMGVSDDELAGVMAHEIGHVNGRHGVRDIERNIGISIISSAVSGQLKKSKKLDLSPDEMDSIGKVNAAIGGLVMLGYSRSDEFDADAKGLTYMSKAGYNPYGMVELMKKFKELEGRSPTKLEVFFQTHPATKARISTMEGIIRKQFPDARPISAGPAGFLPELWQKPAVRYAAYAGAGLAGAIMIYKLLTMNRAKRIRRNPIRPIRREISPEYDPQKYASKAIAIYKEMARVVPDFAGRPELELTKDKMLLYQSPKITLKLYPGIFGILGGKIQKLRAGSVIRLTPKGDVQVVKGKPLFAAPEEIDTFPKSAPVEKGARIFYGKSVFGDFWTDGKIVEFIKVSHPEFEKKEFPKSLIPVISSVNFSPLKYQLLAYRGDLPPTMIGLKDKEGNRVVIRDNYFNYFRNRYRGAKFYPCSAKESSMVIIKENNTPKGIIMGLVIETVAIVGERQFIPVVKREAPKRIPYPKAKKPKALVRKKPTDFYGRATTKITPVVRDYPKLTDIIYSLLDKKMTFYDIYEALSGEYPATYKDIDNVLDVLIRKRLVVQTDLDYFQRAAG